MAYKATKWVNNREPALNAANLNKIEAGIQAAHESSLARFNVRDTGAVGDGITDDTQAFHRAVGDIAAAGGGTLFIPAGTYRITETILIEADNLIVRGAGAGTVIRQTTAGIMGMNVFNASHVQISDLVLDGLEGTGLNGLQMEGCTNCKAVHVECRDWRRYNFIIRESGGRPSTDCHLESCRAVNVVDNGFEMLGAVQCSFNGCRASNVLDNHAFKVWGGSRHCAVVGCMADMPGAPATRSTTGFVVAAGDNEATSDIVISGCMTNGGGTAVRVYGNTRADGDVSPAKMVRQVTVTGCSFSGYLHYGVEASNGAEQVTIANCAFAGLPDSQAISMQQQRGTVRHVVVRGNTATGGKVFLQTFKVVQAVVEGNVITSPVPTNETGIVGRSIISIQGDVGTLVQGNHIFNPGTPEHPAIGILFDETTSDCLACNNMLLDRRAGNARGMDIGVKNLGTATVWISHNIVAGATANSYETGPGANQPIVFG